MARKIGIYYDEQGLREIMKGKPIADTEQNIMMGKLNQVQAEFLQHFGFSGSFELKKVDTKSNRSRTTFRIVAADSKTTAALNREPGWLGKFV